MRVLLSDGSGLTARQTATQLAAGGHAVYVLSPDPICLTQFTRRVRRVFRVPAYRTDPLRWLAAALRVYRDAGMDVLLPTQEQVAVLAARAGLLRAAGVRTVVPSFAALAQVQDKISAAGTLAAAGLAQPESTVLRTPEQAAAWDRFPVFLKQPIGTATTGVRRVSDRAGLAQAVPPDAFPAGGLLAQAPADGPLVMVQGVFAAGELVACHATLRVREGASGGASHKRSLNLPAARADLARLGRHLGWHGALSADAILTSAGPCYIDVNPRLVEPAERPAGRGRPGRPAALAGLWWYAAGTARGPGRRADPSAAAGHPGRRAAYRPGAGRRRAAGRRLAGRRLPRAAPRS